MGCRVVNYVQWDCEADLDAMMASPPAQAHIKEVGALAEHVDPVVYRVAFVGSRRAWGAISVAASLSDSGFSFWRLP